MPRGSSRYFPGKPFPQMPNEPSADQEAQPERRLVPVRIEQAIAAAALALICIISFANVIVRYLTNASFAFTEEISIFLLVVMTFIGASAAFAKGEHIRISFFVDRLPRRLQLAAEALSLLASTAVFALVLYYGALFAFDQWQYHETSPGLGWPQWIYSVWLPVLAGAILLRLLGRAISLAGRARR